MSPRLSIKVPFLDVGAGYRELKQECDEAYQRVMGSGWFVLGEEVEAFEAQYAAQCGAHYCVGTGNGLDALLLILRGYGIGPGDEVVVPAHTFIATWLAVSHAGATPVPVEPDEQSFQIDPRRIADALTARTRAIVTVHIYGGIARMDALRQLASHHGLRLIEDAAQAHGAAWKGAPAGSIGSAAAFSFYPAKNLGAFGDGGAVVTNDGELAERIRALRNYGSTGKYLHRLQGYNSRLDTLQAAFLQVRLKHLAAWNARRKAVAEAYLKGLQKAPGCLLPCVSNEVDSAWHLFVIRHKERDRLRRSLESRGIETAIHYPVPPHLSPAYANLGFKRGDFPITERLADTVLSLPIGPHLNEAQVEHVIQAVHESADD
jgi:dTDP-4-amino-4,6-dideoxygalactose transaminase